MASTAPKKLSTLADRVNRAFELQGEIDAIKLQARPFEAELDEIKEQIKDALLASGLENAKTDAGSFFTKTTVKPTVTDWNKLDRYIQKTGDLSLLTRALSTTAWRERAEAGVEVPGVETETVVSLGSRRAVAKK